MKKKKGLFKKTVNLFTGVVIGGAIGSILGLTLAPKKGSDTRRYLKGKTNEFESYLKKDSKKRPKKMGRIKRFLVKILTPKNKK